MTDTIPARQPTETDVSVAIATNAKLVPIAVAGAVALLLLVGWITTPEFLTYRNFQSIIRAASLLGIIAVGMTFITLSGSFFSLSVAQTGAMAAIAFAAFLKWGWPTWAAVLIVLGLAMVVGVLQGGAVALGGNPIIVTLAFGALLFGSGAWLTDNKTVRTGTDKAEWIGTSRPLGIPLQTWTFIILTILATLVITRSRFGREATLVGANRRAAASSGLRPGRIAMYAFAISAIGAAIAGIFTAAQFSQGQLELFQGADIDAIAAILVGGAAIQGGEGSALRTGLGAVFIASLQNLMVLRGLSFGVRTSLTGVAILVSVSAFTVLRNRRRLA